MGRFLIGFAVGIVVGAAAVILTSPRSGQPQGIGQLVDGAMTAAKRAADLKQQEMWGDYRSRVQQASKPKPAPQKPWESYER
ncbi:MAG: YtxH domain-containing protein [Roseiflexaceae bacterium]|nr:YtxH domain-containing protein [Roseiflexaceae bacterium]